MAEIAEAAGLVRTTVYAHFTSREALIEAIVSRAVADAERARAEARPDDGTGAEALARLVEAAWRAASRYLGLTDAVLRALGVREFRRRRASLHAAFRTVLARGREDGSLRRDMPLEWCVHVCDALVFAAYDAPEAAAAADESQALALLDRTLAAWLAPAPDRAAQNLDDGVQLR
jgi:AcrR family transcriptional regulator